MKIVFTVEGTTPESQIDPRLGRAKGLLVTEDGLKTYTFVETHTINRGSHGVGPKMIAYLVELGADVVITGNGPGQKAAAVASTTNLAFFTGAQGLTAREAYEKYTNGLLPQFGGE